MRDEVYKFNFHALLIQRSHKKESTLKLSTTRFINNPVSLNTSV